MPELERIAGRSNPWAPDRAEPAARPRTFVPPPPSDRFDGARRAASPHGMRTSPLAGAFAPRNAGVGLAGARRANPARAATPDRPHGDPVSVRYVASGDDITTMLVGLVRIGEADGADDHRGMVASILADADNRPIEQLLIEGHGYEGSQSISESHSIRARDLVPGNPTYEELMRLKDHFAPGAEVVLLGCNVGAGPDGEALVERLAEMWGVKVRAGTQLNRPMIPGIESTEVVATPQPDGTVDVEYDESWFDSFARLGSPSADDETRESFIRRISDFGVENLSPGQRYRVIATLMGGYTSESEQDMIMAVFDSLTPAQARAMYRHLEHHPWAGDYKEGWTTDDDTLWNALDSTRAAKLKRYLNGDTTVNLSPRPANPGDDDEVRQYLTFTPAAEIRAMPLDQKVRFIRELNDGYTSHDDGWWIVRLFESASPSQRREMYQRIEGHAWEGDFREGWFTIDDDLWDGLSSDQLDRLRAVMNAR